MSLLATNEPRDKTVDELYEERDRLTPLYREAGERVNALKVMQKSWNREWAQYRRPRSARARKALAAEIVEARAYYISLEGILRDNKAARRKLSNSKAMLFPLLWAVIGAARNTPNKSEELSATLAAVDSYEQRKMEAR